MKAGWVSKPIGAVASVTNGGTPKSNVADFWDGPVQWLTPKDMGKMTGRTIAQTPRTITELGLSKSSARLVPKGSVILSTRAPIGHLALNEVPMAFNQGCRGLVPSDQLDPLFLYYFLLSERDQLNKLGTGTTFKELSATNLKSVAIPLPPLEEQQRIVAILDEAFEGLDRAKANAEANLASARELFQAALGETFNPPGVAKAEWERRPLGNLCTFENGDRGKNYPGKKAMVPEGVPFINAGHLDDGSINWERMDYIPEQRFELLGAGKIKLGDILFCLRGSLGKFGVVRKETLGAIASSLVIIRPSSNIDRNFLAYYFRSSLASEMIESYAGGAAQPNLSAKSLKAFQVPLPPLEEQLRIVGWLDGLRGRTSALEAGYATAKGNTSHLRQSLLAKAFAGELT